MAEKSRKCVVFFKNIYRKPSELANVFQIGYNKEVIQFMRLQALSQTGKRAFIRRI